MLRGEKIVFTGKLDTLSRKQAQALVTALGGKPQAAVTKDTTILVVGKANTNLFQEDPRSLKMQKVEALQQEGPCDIFVTNDTNTSHAGGLFYAIV
jgi:NAD-dependent DNA ligase